VSEIRFNPVDWVTSYDRKHWFPFVEDEDGNITGPGHMDKVAFVLLINQYDEVSAGGPISVEDMTSADAITHEWVVPREIGGGEYRLQRVTEDTPGAVAVTALWGWR
jgi:hypothetical protein